MEKNPTYEALKERIDELGKEAKKYRHAEETLVTSSVQTRLAENLQIDATREVNLKGFDVPMTLFRVAGIRGGELLDKASGSYPAMSGTRRGEV